MIWVIVGIIGLALLIFLWMIVHSAARSVDDETNAMLDEEQTRAVEEILRKREEEDS